MKTKTKELSAKKISRKDALKKAGIYAAFTAAASIVLLTPKKALALSAPIPGWGQVKTPPGEQEGFSPDVNKNVTRDA